MIRMTSTSDPEANLMAHLFVSLHNDWGVVLDESRGWVIGYSHFAPRVCGRYHPLAWPLRARPDLGGFRADGALALHGTCAFVGMRGPAEIRRITLIIRPDGSQALEQEGERSAPTAHLLP